MKQEVIDADYTIVGGEKSLDKRRWGLANQGMREVTAAERKVYVDQAGRLHEKIYVTTHPWGPVHVVLAIAYAALCVAILASANNVLDFMAALIALPLFAYVVIAIFDKRKVELKGY